MTRLRVHVDHLERGALVYLPQLPRSTQTLRTESRQRRGLLEFARCMGFVSVKLIDDRLGKPNSKIVERPGFRKLTALVCGGRVGAVLCLDARTLARGGTAWCHFIDLCAISGTLLMDLERAYDPGREDDRRSIGVATTTLGRGSGQQRSRPVGEPNFKAVPSEERPRPSTPEPSGVARDTANRVAMVTLLMQQKLRKLRDVRHVVRWATESGLELPILGGSARHPRVTWEPPSYNALCTLLDGARVGQHPLSR